MESAVRAVASHEPGRREPVAPPVTAEPQAGEAPVFAADGSAATDRLGRAGEAAFLAELATHARAETPFCIGLFGPPGVGKSDVLDRLLSRATVLAGAPAGSPFCHDLLIARVDASEEGAPDGLLMQGVESALQARHPALAADLHHAGVDPVAAMQDAHAALGDLRQSLDGERQALETLTGREARLVDTVVEAPGSNLDAFARAKRLRIDRSLRQFGFGGGDPIATFKELVRDAALGGGAGARLGLPLRALWAYKGQTRLLVTAVVLALLAWACSVVRSDEAGWIGSVRDMGDRATSAADWLEAHVHWLGPVQTVLMLAAILLLLLNVVRAARFVLPIARGIDLLQQDLDSRRRDLAALIAHQTRRVDGLAGEAEAAAERVATAEARLQRQGGRQGARLLPRRKPADEAAIFFRTLAARMASAEAGHAPRRILLALDGLDRRSSESAAAMLASAHRLCGPGIVTVVAVDPAHLATGFGETDPARAAAAIERCIQLPYRVGASDGSDAARRAYALTLAGVAGASTPSEAPDLTRSRLDAAWRPREQETVAALAPFAGETPRAVKHFVNLYRVARADPRLAAAPAPVFTALALALALDAHGFPDDLTAMERASHGEEAGPSTVLRNALAAAREASGQPVELGQAQRALDVARSYTRRVQASV